VFGQPAGPHDRTQPSKLEIPFGHAFDKRAVSLPKGAVCVGGPSGLRSAIEEHVLSVSGGVGKHKGALRDHRFSTASQRFEKAMRQRSLSLIMRRLGVEHRGTGTWSRWPQTPTDPTDARRCADHLSAGQHAEALRAERMDRGRPGDRFGWP
jgi:hypothetical protein